MCRESTKRCTDSDPMENVTWSSRGVVLVVTGT